MTRRPYPHRLVEPPKSLLRELIERMEDLGFCHVQTYRCYPKNFDGVTAVLHKTASLFFGGNISPDSIKILSVHQFFLPVGKISNSGLSESLNQIAPSKDRTAAATVLEDELRLRITKDLNMVEILAGLTKLAGLTETSAHCFVPYSIHNFKTKGPVVSCFVFEITRPPSLRT